MLTLPEGCSPSFSRSDGGFRKRGSGLFKFFGGEEGLTVVKSLTLHFAIGVGNKVNGLKRGKGSANTPG